MIVCFEWHLNSLRLMFEQIMPKKWTNVLVTVGSTRFDKLIDAITDEDTLDLLRSLGCQHLTIQFGSSSCPSLDSSKFGINIKTFDYKTSIMDDMRAADVVIGHAGAGTALEVLRERKHFLMVINDELMSNHQKELAIALQNEGYLRYCYTNTLADSIISFDKEFVSKPFPPPKPQLFSNFVDNIFFT